MLKFCNFYSFFSLEKLIFFFLFFLVSIWNTFKNKTTETNIAILKKSTHEILILDILFHKNREFSIEWKEVFGTKLIVQVTLILVKVREKCKNENLHRSNQILDCNQETSIVLLWKEKKMQKIPKEIHFIR